MPGKRTPREKTKIWWRCKENGPKAQKTGSKDRYQASDPRKVRDIIKTIKRKTGPEKNKIRYTVLMKLTRKTNSFSPSL